MADVRIQCLGCGAYFKFLGLPCGVDLKGARVSINGDEARLAIAPPDEVGNFLSGDDDVGFTVRRFKTFSKRESEMSQFRQFVYGMFLVIFMLSGVLVGFTFGMMRRDRMQEEIEIVDPKFHYGEQVRISRGFNKGRCGQIIDFDTMFGYTVVVDKRIAGLIRLSRYDGDKTELVHAKEQELELLHIPELAPPLPKEPVSMETAELGK
jgi:hypothetical protein